MSRRLPGVPVGVRLPSLGVGRPYDPPDLPLAPPAPPAAPLGVASDYEAITKAVSFQTGNNPGVQTTSPEIIVYQTTRRWRACDVYLDPSGLTERTGAVLSVFVYAVSSSGAKTLVASGRLSSVSGVISGYRGPQWVCAARGLAEKFEVSFRYLDGGAANFAGEVTMTVVAADEASDPPAWVGVVPMRGGVQLTGVALRGAGGLFVDKPELVGIQAANTAAAARYLQLHEGAGAVLGGAVPVMVWGMGAAIGASVVDQAIRYRARAGYSLAVLVSTTPDTYTAAADGAVSAQYR